MKKLSLFLTILIFPLAVLAQNNTPNDWLCQGKVGGEWNFGLAPSACNVQPFMEANIVEDLYLPLIFDNDAERAGERKRYMQEFYPVLRDFAEYYLKERKPNVTSAEIQAWQKAVYTIAYQESFWSHYRTRDNAIKMMRGDYGHGHGVMQIDDRWHYTKVKDGVAANLIQNLIYALEIYYNAWQTAPSKTCVSSASSWVSRTRAAYSAYNGGESSYCRWTNPNHTWYKNDKNFYDKFQSTAWLNYVADTTKDSSLDVECLSQEKTNCPTDGSNPNPSSLTEGSFYQTEKGKVCAYKGGHLHCIESAKDLACLNLYLGTNVQNTKTIKASVLADYRWSAYDRHNLCVDNVSSLIPVQNSVLTQKTMSLLNSNKSPLKDIPKGEKLYIVDFEVLNNSGFSIYYKVNWKSETGYVAGGSHQAPQELFSLIADESDLQFLANIGDIIEIKNSTGINQRATIQGDLIQNIPKGTKLEVLDRELQGTEGRSYFLVEYKSKKGFVYGGQLNPNTIYKWTGLAERKTNKVQASLKAHLWYVMPKECASDSCENTGVALWSAKKSKQPNTQAYFDVLEEKGNWIRVYSPNDNARGWILKEVTNEF